MNRRGFLGSLAAAAVAPFLPKPKPKPEWKVVSSPWITVHPSQEENVRKLVAESTEGMVDEMSALGESFGESFSMSKGLVSFEGLVGHKGS